MQLTTPAESADKLPSVRQIEISSLFVVETPPPVDITIFIPFSLQKALS